MEAGLLLFMGVRLYYLKKMNGFGKVVKNRILVFIRTKFELDIKLLKVCLQMCTKSTLNFKLFHFVVIIFIFVLIYICS